MICVLIVDDHSIIRESFKTILEYDENINVVGLASNGMEAFEACGRLSPDIVLMDIRMPVCDGITGTKLIKEKYRNIKVLIVSTFDDDHDVNNAMKNGADGYILKDVNSDELVSIIKHTVSGYKVLNSNVYQKLKIYNNFTEDITLEKNDEFKNSITKRQKEIIKLIIEGKSNKEIATRLDLSEGTVRNMISTLLMKYNLQDRTQIAVFGIKNNVV